MPKKNALPPHEKVKQRGAPSRDRISAESRRDPMATEPSRESRDQSDAERQDDGMELSLTQREQMLRDDALQNQLPEPPKRAGIHWFWASTTNQYTSPTWYRRLGYRPVRFEELAGWADANMRGKSGEYAGCITVNEMLLMQCNEGDYQRYMRIVHHEKPMQEQERLRQTVNTAKDEISEEAGRDGLVEEVGTGFKSLDRRVKRPAKFE